MMKFSKGERRKITF